MVNQEEIIRIKNKMFDVIRSSVTEEQKEAAIKYIIFAVQRIKELELIKIK